MIAKKNINNLTKIMILGDGKFLFLFYYLLLYIKGVV